MPPALGSRTRSATVICAACGRQPDPVGNGNLCRPRSATKPGQDGLPSPISSRTQSPTGLSCPQPSLGTVKTKLILKQAVMPRYSFVVFHNTAGRDVFASRTSSRVSNASSGCRLLTLCTKHFGSITANTIRNYRNFRPNELPLVLLLSRSRSSNEVVNVIHGT